MIFQSILNLFDFYAERTKSVKVRFSGWPKFVRHFAFVHRVVQNLNQIFLQQCKRFSPSFFKFVKFIVVSLSIERKKAFKYGRLTQDRQQIFVLNDNILTRCCSRTDKNFKSEKVLFRSLKIVLGHLSIESRRISYF